MGYDLLIDFCKIVMVQVIIVIITFNIILVIARKINTSYSNLLFTFY